MLVSILSNPERDKSGKFEKEMDDINIRMDSYTPPALSGEGPMKWDMTHLCKTSDMEQI